jgi:N-acetylneuraminic acid mutarotase
MEARASLPTAQHGGGTAALSGKIYIFGGFDEGVLTDRVLEYDPAADLWNAMSPIPYGPVQGAGAVAAGSKIVVFGGADELGSPKSDAYSFDPTQLPGAQWTQLNSMPDALSSAAVVFDDSVQSVFVIGGKGFTLYLDSSLSLNVISGIWNEDPLLPLPTARGGAAAAVIGGKIYLTGGVGNDGVPLADTIVYDPMNPGWEFFSVMPTARFGHGSAVINDTIYNVGGFVLDDLMPGVTGAVEAFDPIRGRWAGLTALTDEKALTFTAAAKNASGETSLFVAGGTAINPNVYFAETIEIAP